MYSNKKDIPKRSPRYRIVWKNKTTGETGKGAWIEGEEMANTMVALYASQHPENEHWLETEKV